MNQLRALSPALVLTAVTAVGLEASGQAPAAPDPVYVDVFAADGTGRPVPALRPDDVEVLQDGAAVPVVACVASGASRRGKASEVSRLRQLQVVVFVDDATTPAQRAAALAGADAALRELLARPGSRVLVASGGAGAAIRQRLTTDPAQISRALAALERGAGGDGQRSTARAGAEAEGLPALVESLRALPGRTAVVVVTGSLAALSGKPDPGGQPALLRTAAEAADAAGVALYAIATDGAPGVAAARVTPQASGGPVPLADPGDALAAVVRDLDAAWAVGFLPSSRGDGARHRLDVRAKREGITLRAGSVFADVPDDERMAARTAAALLLGFEDNPLGIQLTLASDQKPKDGMQVTSVLVTIPLANLSFEPKTVSHDSDLTLWLAARDGEGPVVRAPKVRFPVSVPNDRVLTALTQTASYEFKVPLKAGPCTFAVTVRDEIGRQSSTTIATTAPAADAATGEMQ
ncbi:MAG TPA: hypothetical protein VMT19_00870 [Thermoanaerobaculaceae bacterium]|nr:hypothetical protein [Thermoanaerobaculaceae bacterium]